MSQIHPVKDYWNVFWTNRTNHGSQNDLIFQAISLEMILRFLNPGEKILSVGCGDGFGFDRYCEIVERVVGMDYSEKAIQDALLNCQALVEGGRAAFMLGDLLTPEATLLGQFDVVISERCLCNLMTRGDQKRGIEIIHDYLKRGGRAVICEPSLQGYEALDVARERLSLPRLKRHWHNLLVDEALFDEAEGLEVERRYTFGVYSLISRIFHPLYVSPEEPRFSSKINEIAAQICQAVMTEEIFSDLPSQHALYVLRKAQ